MDATGLSPLRPAFTTEPGDGGFEATSDGVKFKVGDAALAVLDTGEDGGIHLDTPRAQSCHKPLWETVGFKLSRASRMRAPERLRSGRA